MQVRTDFPRPTRTIANTWIPLADGTRLAARLWLPDDAARRAVPAILEYMPYRKDDATAARDERDARAGSRPRLRLRARRHARLRRLRRHPRWTSTSRRSRTMRSRCIAWLAAQPWCTAASA